MNRRGPLGGIMDRLLPWPGRRDRQAAIRAARQERDASRAAADDAGDVEAAIRRMTAGNHWAQAIASELAAPRRRRGDEP